MMSLLMESQGHEGNGMARDDAAKHVRDLAQFSNNDHFFAVPRRVGPRWSNAVIIDMIVKFH
ncbi:MAG: hypothetical protein QHC78_05550 [Pigmentiphaga sp.]|uniref:hypothetical protein n=1 Tax=Pigmentiphaga sp. TaxID=1977564 RepID=UPI0029A3222E|nr:hypothetical protein [Pigmentiphaga sp.]MDX3905137.1 hypothetical protein [Pigmentiphaga sp.]